jgi:hypothetical protein
MIFNFYTDFWKGDAIMSTNNKKNRLPSATAQGQMILVIARWVLVIAGLALVLWNPGPIDTLRFKILFLLLLAGGNFYLGAQVLRRRPMANWIVYAASLADISIISLIIVSEGGFDSNTYIFYYPAMLAISVAFPMVGTALYAAGAVSVYTLISLASMSWNEGNFQVLVTRILMIIAVAVIGALYRQMERKRNKQISSSQEVAEDIFFGQIAIIWARWFFIIAAAILVLWTAETTGELTMGVLLVAALMSVNFFVHGRYLTEKPANQTLILITTMIDLFLITLVVMFWGPGGLESNFFIFYYPLFFAFALVFPPGYTAGYTILALTCYGGAIVMSDFQILTDLAALELFVMRVITLAAMSGLGTYYYRVQRQRHRAIVQKQATEHSIPANLRPIATQPE